MSVRLAHLAQRLFNVPLAIHPRKAEVVIAALAERLGILSLSRFSSDGVVMVPLAYEDNDPWAAPADAPEPQPDRGYDLVGDIALIPVSGTLVQKNGTLRPFSGITGYDGVRQAFAAALTDPAVAKIALDVDSPGGEVNGCFDLVDFIFEARGDKPIWAILTENACSGAYAIASAADRIAVPRTGLTGSIGVIALHADFSKALEQGGIKVTLIVSEGADRKTDGYPEVPLAKDAYDAMKAQIDQMGALFCETVARNRGLKANAVRDLAAATFLGPAGLPVGLADEVAAPDAAFRALAAL